MALLDPVRRRVRLDHEELAALLALAADEPAPPQEVLDRLGEAGAIEAGAPAPWLSKLLEPIASPSLHAVAEVVAERRLVVVAQAWCSEDGCVLGRLGLDGCVELCEIDPGMIPAALAVEVGLARRPEPAARERLVVPVAELSASPEEHLGAIFSTRIGSWRIGAASPGGGDSVAVLDSGGEGLWMTEPANEDGQPAIAFVPVSGDELATRLTDLFART